jgi:hypothetical protein
MGEPSIPRALPREAYCTLLPVALQWLAMFMFTASPTEMVLCGGRETRRRPQGL